MKYGQLIDYLDARGHAREIAPGRIEFTFENTDGAARQVEIVMTPDEWGDFASSIWGNYDDAVADLLRMVTQGPPDLHYRVYGTYELVPSATPEPPLENWSDDGLS